MRNKLRKAVFPVAGLGTRFLPATKANPKEMLPIVDKPLIQYAVEEAIAAGITQMVFVTSSSKRAIEDHFDKNYELETELQRRGDHELLKQVKRIVPSQVSCIYIRQPEALGLGHAVLCAAPAVGDEPFAVILADDLIDDGGRGCLAQMAEIFNTRQQAVIGIETVAPDMTDRYGIVDTAGDESELAGIRSIVEKPAPAQAPSRFGVVGRYIFPNSLFDCLRRVGAGAGGEVQLTDAISLLLEKEQAYAYRFKGRRFDCGSKLGYIEATLNYALQHPELGAPVRKLLAEYDVL